MTFLRNFLQRFEDFAIEKKLLQNRQHILVGVSGGPDSTALLQALYHLRPKYRLHILAAHVNYNTRGEDSKADEAFVKKLCFERNIGIVSKQAHLDLDLSNFENEAREIRMAYFETLQKQYRIHRIALGHNKEDQAETVLFRMFRGAAVSGLKGILPLSGDIIHPLLPFSRSEIEHFLVEEGIQWRTDASNLENHYTRNRIRNELFPWIETNINPQIVDKLYDSAGIFAETEEILRDIVLRRLNKHNISKMEFSIKIPISLLEKQRPVLRFYMYREIYNYLKGDEKDFYTVHFERIEKIFDSRGSKQIDLPSDIVLFKEYDHLIFCRKDAIEEPEPEAEREIPSIRNRFMFGSYRFFMKKVKQLPAKKRSPVEQNVCYLDMDKIEFPLTLRYRRPGDRFNPFGMEHSKKLKDFFIDEKVSRFERDKIVILTDQNNILWICGYRSDQRSAVTEETKNILMVRVERVNSSRPRTANRKKKG